MGSAPEPAACGAADQEFKNFHRLLCECFDYAHDEVYWKRDQLSLIEHIRGRVNNETPTLIVEKEPDYWNRGHFYEGSKPWIDPQKVFQLPIGTQLFAVTNPQLNKEKQHVGL